MREVTLAMAAAAAEVPPDQLCENFVSDLPIWLGYYIYTASTCLQGKVNSFFTMICPHCPLTESRFRL